MERKNVLNDQKNVVLYCYENGSLVGNGDGDVDYYYGDCEWESVTRNAAADHDQIGNYPRNSSGHKSRNAGNWYY